MERIQKEPVGSESVRRAAFWEMLDTNVTGPGYYACQRLAQSAVPADQKLQAALFFEGPEGALIDAARVALDARHMEFTAALIGYLRTHNDRPAEWAARILAQQRVAAALPDLLDKLKDPDSGVRKWSAFALCWQPSGRNGARPARQRSRPRRTRCSSERDADGRLAQARGRRAAAFPS